MSDKRARVAVRLDSDELAALQDLADDYGLPITTTLRTLLHAEVARRARPKLRPSTYPRPWWEYATCPTVRYSNTGNSITVNSADPITTALRHAHLNLRTAR